METFKIQGVEVFSAGEWNGDKYSSADLHAMVEAFEANKVGYRPFLKLGHDKEQKLLQKDGYPAAGWVDRLYVQGEKLIADFSDIPKKVFDLIKSKAYRKVSCEIWWDLKVGEKKYSRLLGAVALLGADNPGVMNLNDILGMYAKVLSQESPRSYAGLDLKLKGGSRMEKTEKEIQLETQLAAANKAKEETEAKLKEFSANQTTASKEVEELKTKLAELTAKSAEREKADAEALAKSKQETFLSDLSKEKLLTPAMKPYIVALLGAEQKEYSFEGRKEKISSKEELLKETLKLFKKAAEMNFEGEEGTETEAPEKKSYGKNDELDPKAEAEVAKYMKENGCTYGKAVKALKLNKKKS